VKILLPKTSSFTVTYNANQVHKNGTAAVAHGDIRHIPLNGDLVKWFTDQTAYSSVCKCMSKHWRKFV